MCHNSQFQLGLYSWHTWDFCNKENCWSWVRAGLVMTTLSLSSHCTILDNWDDIMDEICRSNIIQRDNVKFAKKLSKHLVPLAKEKNKMVSYILVTAWRNMLTRKDWNIKIQPHVYLFGNICLANMETSLTTTVAGSQELFTRCRVDVSEYFVDPMCQGSQNASS